jgi:uncharacterized surface protein with fasciclin (FAS1) repeats
MKTQFRYSFVFGILVCLVLACSEDWTNHYESTDKTVDSHIWDSIKVMPEYSEFVKYAQEFHIDTIIRSSNTKTLFIPDNEAFKIYLEGDTTGFKQTMNYHIVNTFFMLRNVEDKRRMRTFAEKYALIENRNNVYYFDGIEIVDQESPLFLNGKYYQLSSVVQPKPNLYEYLKWNNPSIGRYIDTQDSIVLDRNLSKPIGFTDEGETIYDSVKVVYNIFEENYFRISEEYRNLSATMVLPDQELYEAALDKMVESMEGTTYQSHEDIPESWQNSVLIPVLLNRGTYGGLLEPDDFVQERIANIRGDSVDVDFQINPYSRTICSNGLVYNYMIFEIGDSLYREKKLEGEVLCEPIGANRYAWIEEEVDIDGNQSFFPSKQEVLSASNDSVLNVEFDSNYEGEYKITLKLKHVFPQQYRLVWKANFRPSGIYSIYVNGEQVKLGIEEKESVDTYSLTNGFFSVLGYKLWPDESGFCILDGYVDNITEYGDVTITIEYVGSGVSSDNGLSIDFIGLLSA